MPELPEVETVRRGVAPLLVGQVIKRTICRVPKLRWEIDPELNRKVAGQRIHSVRRRAKYLLFDLDHAVLVIHLGMTGILRVLDADIAPGKHDHFDLVLECGKCLRLNDSRRFGAVLLLGADIEKDKRFSILGPEPLSDDFDIDYLVEKAQNCRGPIKNFLMNQKTVVGVGNIYASEALFEAGIDPRRPAQKISRQRYALLIDRIKAILDEAIRQGGTTIRDFEGADGKPGYFKQALKVYGRGEAPCVICQRPIRNVRLAGRSTYFCPQCQK